MEMSFALVKDSHCNTIAPEEAVEEMKANQKECQIYIYYDTNE